MADKWKYKQFINHESGRRDFEKWINNEISPTAKAFIHEAMDSIEIMEQLDYPALKLQGYKEIWEIKVKADNKQYRPLFCIGQTDKEIWLLIGATKTGSKGRTKWKPSSAPKTAEKRRKYAINDRRHIIDYIRRT
jgi:hypothetical protein